jgi:hypothetical protein
VNFIPTVTALLSPESGAPPGVPDPHSEHGHETLTLTPAEGVSMLPLSSVARDMIVVEGLPCATQLYDQFTL